MSPVKLADAVIYFRGDRSQLKSDLDAAKGQTTSWASGLGGILKQAFSFALGGAILGGVQSLTRGVVNLGKSMLMTAARAEEMRLVAQSVGNIMGLTTERVDAEIQTIKDLGITTTVASRAVAQFARHQLDMANASELARVAQNAAVLAGEDSSQTLDGLIYGITSLNTRVLRTRGILIDSQAAFQKYGASIGKAASDLTLAEKQAAYLNAVIEAGIPLTGLYEKAMLTFSKQLRSVPRNLAELGEAWGQHITRPAGQAVREFRGFLSGLTAVAQEGGALYPVLQKIGAGLSVLMDALKGAGEAAGKAGGEFLANFGNKMLQAAKAALNWGVNISVNLADGLISGAVQAITAALNFIGDLLASWLAPGSPPKVAPLLVEWGISAMNEWLSGFTQADFSILEGVQGYLQQAFSALTAGGAMDEIEASELFIGISEALTEALATGEGLSEVLDTIAQEAGQYGVEIAELILLQQDLAAATEEVEAAEEALSQAQEARDEAAERAKGLREEYERLALAGASMEVLEAKRAEAEEAESALSQAEAQVEAEEERLAAAEEQAGALQEQVGLQEQLLHQLLRMGQEWSGLEDLMAGAIGGGGSSGAKKLKKAVGGALEEIGEMTMPTPVLDTANLDDAFEQAKERIRQALGEIFAPLHAAWERLQPKLGEMGEQIGRVAALAWAGFQKYWPKIEGFFGMLLQQMGIEVPAKGATLREAFNTTILPAFTDLMAKISFGAIPAFSRLQGWMEEKLPPVLEDFAELIGLDQVESFQDLAEWVGNTSGELGELWKSIEQDVSPVLEGFKKNVLEPLAKPWEAIAGFIGDVIEKLGELIAKLGELPDIPEWMVPGSPTPLERGLMGITEAMKRAVQTIPDFSAQIATMPVAPGIAAAGGDRTYNRRQTVNINSPYPADGPAIQRYLDRQARRERGWRP